MKSVTHSLFVAFLFLAVLAFATPGSAKETENVFVVVIDGLRNEEAFDDPCHRYIRHLWYDLIQANPNYKDKTTMIVTIDPALNADSRIHVYRKNPRMASYNDSLFAVWSENEATDMGNERVYFMKKDPGVGQPFSQPMLPNDPPVGRWSFFSAVAANVNGVHVVWLDGRALEPGKDTFTRYSFFWKNLPVLQPDQPSSS